MILTAGASDKNFVAKRLPSIRPPRMTTWKAVHTANGSIKQGAADMAERPVRNPRRNDYRREGVLQSARTFPRNQACRADGRAARFAFHSGPLKIKPARSRSSASALDQQIVGCGRRGQIGSMTFIRLCASARGYEKSGWCMKCVADGHGTVATMNFPADGKRVRTSIVIKCIGRDQVRAGAWWVTTFPHLPKRRSSG